MKTVATNYGSCHLFYGPAACGEAQSFYWRARDERRCIHWPRPEGDGSWSVSEFSSDDYLLPIEAALRPLGVR